MYIELIEEQNVCYSTTPTSNINFDNLIESEEKSDSDLLYVPAEGIHSIITGNYTYYEPSCIEESVPLWTYPYGIPIIFHHKEHDSQIIGRIQKAEYIKSSKRTKTPALKFIFGIGDKNGKEGIQNGTLSTISIGAKAVDLRCSICGKNLVQDGFCEHEKGKTYDNKLCYWVVKKIIPKEVSYVIVPSDKYAYSEAPLSGKEIISISESIKDNEVKDLSGKNLFHDYYSAALAEAQEKALLEDENKNSQEQKPEPKKEDEKVSDPEPAQTVDNKSEEKNQEPKKDEKATDVKDEGSEDEIKDNNNKDDKNSKEDNDNKKVGKDDKKEDNIMDIKDSAVKFLISKLEAKIKELEQEVVIFKEKYEEADKLRESAEKKMVLMESEQKKDLIEKINSLRTSLGLTEKDNDLLIKSDIQMLNNDLDTLKELSSSTINSIKTIEKVQSKSLVNDKFDNTSKEQNLKESEDFSSLDDKMNRFFKR